jgi:uncharacterized protein (DUF1501 family)
MKNTTPDQPRKSTRRNALTSAGYALASAGSAGLMLSCSLNSTAHGATTTPDSTPLPHFPAKAKHLICLHMIGAPSQLDLFDRKPELVRRHGQPCPESVTRNRDFAFIGKTSVLAGSPWKFRQHGDSGQVLSELLPELATVADELAVIRSIHTNEINHAPAQMFLHSGSGRSGRPTLGAWLSWGLGSENPNLPAWVVLLSGPPGGAGTSLWSAGFLPGIHQGTQFRAQGDPVLFLSNPPGVQPSDRQRQLSALRSLNDLRARQTLDPAAAVRSSQYDLALRMQSSVPELLALNEESQHTLTQYGASAGQPSFAANCLLARRMIERGVRTVELFDADWDHHASIHTALPRKCREVDRPIAALIRDLQQRGLLQDTLILWISEFGRTPLQQGGTAATAGRDHHKDAFTMWLAGAGVRPGMSLGATDDFGMDIAERPVHVHDLQATVLHLLGLNHEQLTWRYQGRDFRLTDVHGQLLHEILL